MHTKGPWTHNNYGQVFCSKDKTPIATVWNSRQSNDENDANANLIVAAPELLEALDGVTQFMKLTGLKVPEKIDHILTKAKGV